MDCQLAAKCFVSRSRVLGLGRNELGIPSKHVLARATSLNIPSNYGPHHTHCEQDSSAAEQDTPISGLSHAGLVAGLTSSLTPAMPLVMAAVSLYTLPLMVLMAFMPAATVTRNLLGNSNTLIPLAVAYAVMLVCSFTPSDLSTLLPGSLEAGLQNMAEGNLSIQFVPSLGGISTLFSRNLTAVSVWAHLQFVSCFCARYIWKDGLDQAVVTTHSILLCVLFAPLGFISHMITSALFRKKKTIGSASNGVPSKNPPTSGTTASSEPSTHVDSGPGIGTMPSTPVVAHSNGEAHMNGATQEEQHRLHVASVESHKTSKVAGIEVSGSLFEEHGHEHHAQGQEKVTANPLGHDNPDMPWLTILPYD